MHVRSATTLNFATKDPEISVPDTMISCTQDWWTRLVDETVFNERATAAEVPVRLVHICPSNLHRVPGELHPLLPLMAGTSCNRLPLRPQLRCSFFSWLRQGAMIRQLLHCPFPSPPYSRRALEHNRTRPCCELPWSSSATWTFSIGDRPAEMHHGRAHEDLEPLQRAATAMYDSRLAYYQ
jgi:hypothetical protein